MPYIDTSKLPTVERLPGWRGRYFDSAHMTFAHYEFDAGSSIHLAWRFEATSYHAEAINRVIHCRTRGMTASIGRWPRWDR